ncbi:hypothetical protein A2988_00250 [Candidatus Azambacteria bacterium RIFCSPLOWO2_01_FULL_46_25]|uniref:Uncharacterized protein n=1 Tax=Candidatus Azambacteria bacterium RIFCSPLOWO2_01_FULL_46_25 TaxID=1797298 RepID=A0A1F5BTG6_9BACT|nr:MAG: hypothetical protein A2988_00250 [Candidatus Azambacteria bacterium RIFCSPLOWO2_01_FULL_46_25]OGD37144.1 MAG: hypothetical protein A2850_04200 [Candidatus Azambacteria bacterium RIFCSPHIGHO2_01_FULL_51_74]
MHMVYWQERTFISNNLIMRIIKSIAIATLFVPLLVFGQGPSTILPNAGLTPDSAWYFFDKLGEAMRDLFTFNKEAKARLQIVFAAERIAEIKVLLEAKGVAAPGLAVAEGRLQEHLTRAAGVLDAEKAKGKDVRALAKSLNEDFDASKSALEDVFKEKKRVLEQQEKEVKAKIVAAREINDTAQVAALETQLAALKAEKKELEKKEDEQESAFEDDEEKLERTMEKKDEAEKMISEAEAKKQEFTDEAAAKGFALPADAFKQFDQHLAQAKELFAKENYKGAALQARQAKKALEQEGDALERLSDEKEEAEEAKGAEDVERDIQKEIQERESELMKKQEEPAHDMGNMMPGEMMAETIMNVNGQNFSFAPSEIRVKKGEKVKVNFANAGGWPHDFVIDELNVRTPQVTVGESASVEFIADKAGTFEYYCSVGQHRQNGMKGKLIVSE